MTKKKQIHLVTVGGKVPPSIRKGVEKKAAERRWTVSQYVRLALENQLAQDLKEQPST